MLEIVYLLRFSSVSIIIISSQMENEFPFNFAQRLLELEAAVEDQSTIQTITQLNEHYRIGMDYYIEKQPRKAIYFKKKMNALLSHPDNLRILEQNTKKIKEQKSPKTNRNSLNQRKLNQQITKFHNVAETCIKSMVENSNKAVGKIEELRKRDISKQEKQLNERIMLKRARSSEKLRIQKLFGSS